MIVQYFAAFWMTYVAMLCLSLARSRHYQQCFAKQPEEHQLQRYRWWGRGLLVAALVPSWLAWNGPIGIVAWFGMMSLSGFALVLLIGLKPRWAVQLPAVGATLWAVMVVLTVQHV